MNEAACLRLVASRIEPEGLTIHQPRRGYRFGQENLLLPDLLGQTGAVRHASPTTSIVDLGAGCGILGMLALHRLVTDGKDAFLTAVERNPVMARAAAASISALPPSLQHRATLLEADLTDPATQLPPADIVLCNPPFYPPGHGRTSSNPAVHEATHAVNGGVSEFLLRASTILTPDGHVFLLLPFEQLAPACVTASSLALSLRWCFLLDARHTGRPFRTWIVLQRAPGPATFRHLCVTALRKS